VSEAPPGIDLEPVSKFLAEQVPSLEPPLHFELIGGGRSNLTYRVTGGDGSCVLRRPPLGHVLPTAHDMAREFRVLSALAPTDVPVPAPLALCEDPEVNGMPFYLMQERRGVVIEERMPAGYADTAEERRRIGLALVEVLARLHAVDWVAAGLEGFGRPEGYLERQVRRWSQQWQRSKVAELPAIDELLRRLAAALPRSPSATIVHGDYRLGNVALAADDPGRILAVFDWEMATLGDPLADLGYLLMSWGEPGEPQVASLGSFRNVTAQSGFLRRAELVEAYAERSGRSTEAVDFYVVLAYTKLAVISEGIYARHLQGKTVGEKFEGLTRASVPLAEHALALADASPVRALRAH
jgi:aminoglycoside phosphotransferase (APT) family kinase protein